jgi:hypothetical protein
VVKIAILTIPLPPCPVLDAGPASGEQPARHPLFRKSQTARAAR